MSIEKQIMTAVARTDLIWCAAARVMVVLALAGIAVIIGVLAARGMANVDRRATADITSEGPDGDWTEAYYEDT